MTISVENNENPYLCFFFRKHKNDKYVTEVKVIHESAVFSPISQKVFSPQKLFPKGGRILNISQFYGQPFSYGTFQLVEIVFIKLFQTLYDNITIHHYLKNISLYSADMNYPILALVKHYHIRHTFHIYSYKFNCQTLKLILSNLNLLSLRLSNRRFFPTRSWHRYQFVPRSV